MGKDRPRIVGQTLRSCVGCGGPTSLDSLCGTCQILESLVFQFSNLEQLKRALDRAYKLREKWVKGKEGI